MLEITTGNTSSACFYTLKQAQGLYALMTLLDRSGNWAYILRHIRDYLTLDGKIDLAILVTTEQLQLLQCITIHE